MSQLSGSARFAVQLRRVGLSWWLPLLLTAGLAAGCRTVQVTERQLLRPPRADSTEYARFVATVPQPYVASEHRVPVSSGAWLQMVALRRPGAQHTVLYFGGNMFAIATMGLQAARYLAPLDANVILVDHRGYGRSTGAATSIAQLQDDALAVYDAALGLPEVRGTRLVVHGHSLGSFLAGHVARHRTLDGLVLEASATTGDEWIRHADRRPWFVRPVVRLSVESGLRQLGNAAVMATLDEPLLLLVGSDDVVMPPALSRRLYELARLPAAQKQLHVLPGATHNDVPAHPEFAQRYRDFLAFVLSDAPR